jgi:error-prone DNA polymerase
MTDLPNGRGRGGYVELHCHSAFSLLDGAASPEALAQRAAALGLPALALTDHDDLGGAIRFAQAAHAAGITPITGAELTIEVPVTGPQVPDDLPGDPLDEALGVRRHHLTLLAETRDGYGNISTLITRARMDRSRGTPGVSLELLARHAEGVIALTGCPRGWVPWHAARGDERAARAALGTLHDVFGDRLVVECWDHGLPEERATSARLIALAGAAGLPWVVTNDVHYARVEDRIVHDVLCALRHARPLEAMGTRLRPNGEWHLRSAAQMRRRWRHAPDGIRATLAVAERCTFRMDQLTPTLPAFPLPPGVDADEYLERLVDQGAYERWGAPGSAGRTPAHDRQMAHELGMIRKLGLAGFFLIVWDIVRFARREGILCQGRGSAANSAVCYCLAITAVDPIKLKLLFERFLSDGRKEAPDIDIDFAHNDRERVLQYVYERYGREHAAMVCEQISYRGRSAVRDAARVLGFSVEQGDALATLSDRFSARATAEGLEVQPATGSYELTPTGVIKYPPWHDKDARDNHVERRNPTTAILPASVTRSSSSATGSTEAGGVIARAGLDPGDRRVQLLADVVRGLHELPRHRSIHVGGFVLTEEPLSTVVPIEPASMADRTVIQWEKDDLDSVGLVKIDLLGLGILTLMQECVKYIRQTRGVTIDFAQLDMDDAAVYDMLCEADTVGVFQVESRAQMSTLPRLRPRTYYDLVVEVALIRPGPIQGDMVHPYLRRRAGQEPVEYLHASLEPLLERTLGVPLFQEQGMQVAITAAGFTPTEADELRRSMGHKRSRERMAALHDRLIDGMQRNGITGDVAARIVGQLSGFADYGFPESHAASFALLVYASAYLKCHYAPEFTAALLNAQPMGFYAPGTIVEDARRHGVQVLPVDVTRSEVDTTLEWVPGRREPAMRLGLRMVRGLGTKVRERLTEVLATGGRFTSVNDLVARSGLDSRHLRHLAEAGALDSLVPDEPSGRRRRAAVWRLLEAARGDAGPLAPSRVTLDVPTPIRAMTPAELTTADYRMTGLSLIGHPMLHVRAALAPNGVWTATRVTRDGRNGQAIAVAGLVICRQRPGTAKGFVFLTLEDETGLINIIVTPKHFEEDGLIIAREPMLLIRGRLQVEQGIAHVKGERFIPLKADAGEDWSRSRNFH